MTESLKLQPKDRDYNKNGGKREARFESIGGVYAMRSRQRKKFTSSSPSCTKAGSLNLYGFGQADCVWYLGGICPTIMAHLQGQIGHAILVLEVEEHD